MSISAASPRTTTSAMGNTTGELYGLAFITLIASMFMAIDRMPTWPDVQMTPFYSAGAFLVLVLTPTLGFLAVRGARWHARLTWGLSMVFAALCGFKIIG